MLSPPEDLAPAALAAALARGWGLTVAALAYRAVGFGSHHWEATDAEGTRWFVTADDLEAKRDSAGDPLDAAFGRLRAALAAARDLRACGASFVLAPVPARDGEPLARAGDRFAVALYPFVDGQSFEWGEFSGPAHRRAVLDLVTAVHTAPAAARRHALADDFAIPHRDELVAALRRADLPSPDLPSPEPPSPDLGHAGLRAGDDTADCGPYAHPAALLVAGHAAAVRRLMARYDELVRQGRALPSRAVLTHGEPHPGNTMLTSGRWLLIDWDTAAVAPPERDLWSLDPGDGSILAAYAGATGVTPLPSMLELYRIRWDLADIAAGVSRFRRRHPGSPDDDKEWELLRALLAGLA